MRHDTTILGIAGAISSRDRRRCRRNKRLRAGARELTPNHQQDIDVIDEAFASFTRVDSPDAHGGGEAGESGSRFPVNLTDCLSAQLNALDRQRSELVQLLRRIDREPQSV
jgi:hypothetical protein